MFEHNLSVHHTDAVAEHWKENLKNFHDTCFYPANLTLLIQAIDCHIGIIYKMAVTKAVLKLLVEKMEEAKRAGMDFDASKALSAAEKCVPIMKVVADEHKWLASLLAFKCAFVAMGTWMPIENLLAADGAANGYAHKWKSLHSRPRLMQRQKRLLQKRGRLNWKRRRVCSSQSTCTEARWME